MSANTNSNSFEITDEFVPLLLKFWPPEAAEAQCLSHIMVSEDLSEVANWEAVLEAIVRFRNLEKQQSIQPLSQK